MNTSKIVPTMKAKRDAQYGATGFETLTHSNHMCTILKNGMPVSWGSNIYNVNGIQSTEHAEAQALRRLYDKIGKTLNAKKITIDLCVIRTNGGNSRPCKRCINTMKAYSTKFNIRYIYYTCPSETNGIRCVKFSQLENENHHICSFDRNITYSKNNRNIRGRNSQRNSQK